MTYYGVYCVENKINGKKYIGWSEDCDHRLEQHLLRSKRSKTIFHCALKKYGIEAFEFWVIQYLSSKEEAKEVEKYWITTLNTNRCNNGYGYNMTNGGEGTSGHKHTDALKKYWSDLRKGRPSEKRGTKVSDKIKQKLSVAQKGENNARSILTDKDVIRIRELINQGERHKDIAKLFGVNPSQISKINLGQTWKHVK